MTSTDAPEAVPSQLQLALVWRRDDEGSLEGELRALNIAERAVRVSSKPRLAALGLAGEDLEVDMIVTAEMRVPGFVLLEPGERARAPVLWSGWDGPPCSGRFIVDLAGGQATVRASGPRQPRSQGPATLLSSWWFERVP